MINKKIATEVGLGIILLVAIAMGGSVWLQNRMVVTNDQELEISDNKTQGVVEEAVELEKSDNAIKAGYKIVEVKNPKVQFSFEVPEKWLTETRNSGEKQLSDQEMKDFLSSGASKIVNDYWSSYIDYPVNDIAKMKHDLLLKNMKHFPLASVANDLIQYTDTSWSQIDFYLEKNNSVSTAIDNLKKQRCLYKCPVYETIYKKISKDDKRVVPMSTQIGEIENTCSIGSQQIANLNSEFIKFGISRWDGEFRADKECSGGIINFINIGNGFVLKIVKQARGDDQFEKDFENLIQTLEITVNQAQASDETANWQTYKNEKYGFELKYPLDTKIQMQTNNEQYQELEFTSESSQDMLELKVRNWKIYKIEEGTPGTFWEKLAKNKWEYFISNWNKVAEGECDEEALKNAPGINPTKCTIKKESNYLRVDSNEASVVYTKGFEIGLSATSANYLDSIVSTIEFK